MKVLLISHACQARTEGQPKAVCLGRMPGLELRVLTPDRWFNYGRWRRAEQPPAGEFHLEVGRVRWPWLGPLQFYAHWYPHLRQVLQSFRPDIIDLWEEPWGLVSAHTCWLRDRLLPQTRIICETEQNVNKRLPPPFEQFRRYVNARSQFVVCRNEEAKEVMRAKGYAGPLQVVPNAVDAELFRPLPRPACRALLPALAGCSFIAGYVGRLVPEKGLMDLVNALEFCGPEIGLCLVGDGEMRTALESRVRALGKTGQVLFVDGKPLSELPAYMNAFDVLVLPSRTTPSWKEQFGRVIIEAYACGVPVLGSSSGAIPDVVATAGEIFPEGDIRALAGHLKALAAAPERIRAFGTEGRRLVEAHYTWQRVAETMLEIYQRVLRLPAQP